MSGRLGGPTLPALGGERSGGIGVRSLAVQ